MTVLMADPIIVSTFVFLLWVLHCTVYKSWYLEIFSFLCATRLSYQQVMFMVVTSVGLILKYCEQVGSLGIFLVCQVTQCC